jgi:TonB family protein
MHQCRTTYSKALLLSVMIHVAVVWSAIAFAQYGEAFFSRDFRSITVSLLGNADPVHQGNVSQSKRKQQGASVPALETPKQELKNDLPKEDDLRREAPPAHSSGEQREEKAESGAGPGPGSRSPVTVGEGHEQTGEISLEQWQFVHSALEKVKTYPRIARERGVEGVVLVRFKVLPTGEIEKVDIVKSSGSDILDTASVRTVYRAAPMPYVNGWVEVPMSYVLK